MDTAIANKFIKTLSVAEEPTRGRVQGPGQDTKGNTPPTDIFKTGAELLYGGQGKLTNTTNLTQITNDARTCDDEDTNRDTSSNKHAGDGLAPPTLTDTNTEVTGDDRKQLRKQNKRQKQLRKAEQTPTSHWTEHTGAVTYASTPMPRTRDTYRNSMCPTGRALHHPSAETLREWATFGCPTRTGRN